MQDATIVSVLCDLSLRDDPGTKPRRSISDYLQYGQALLALNVPTIIYCEPRYVEVLEALGDTNPTLQIIPFRLEESPYCSYYDRIVTNLKSMTITNMSPEKFTPHYYILMWTKMILLSRVSNENPFNTNYFVWMDFGLTHTTRTLDIDQLNFYDAIHLGCRRYLLEVTPEYFSTISGYFVGGLFSLPKHLIPIITSLFHQKVEEIINLGYVLVDEQILPLIYLDHPYYFSLYYCDYPSIFTNYQHLRTDFHVIFSLIKTCSGHHSVIVTIAEKLYLDWKEGYAHLTPHELVTLMAAYYISLVYVDPIRAEQLAEEIFQQGLKDPEFRFILLKNDSLANVLVSRKQLSSLYVEVDYVNPLLEQILVDLASDYNITVKTKYLPNELYNWKIANPRYMGESDFSESG